MIEVQDETETAKCVPINDEIESQDTELQEEERSLHSDEDSDEDDRSTTDQGSPPPVDKQNEIADEILAGFDNETADDKTTDLNEDFLSELNDMTVKPDESCIDSEDESEFIKELENFDTNDVDGV
jgi:hypothetical protein